MVTKQHVYRCFELPGGLNVTFSFGPRADGDSRGRRVYFNGNDVGFMTARSHTFVGVDLDRRVRAKSQSRMLELEAHMAQVLPGARFARSPDGYLVGLYDNPFRAMGTVSNVYTFIFGLDSGHAFLRTATKEWEKSSVRVDHPASFFADDEEMLDSFAACVRKLKLPV